MRVKAWLLRSIALQTYETDEWLPKSKDMSKPGMTFGRFPLLRHLSNFDNEIQWSDRLGGIFYILTTLEILLRQSNKH